MRISSTLDSSLILCVFVLFLKLVATMRADLVVDVEILATLRAGEGELCTAGGTGLVVRVQGTAAVRAEIDATGWALFVVLADRLAAIATEGGSLDCGAGPFLLAPFIFEPLVEFSATMGADRGLGRDLLITYGAIETELCSALGTDGIVGIHLGSTLGTACFLLVEIVDFLVVSQICGHDSPRF
jgi:hypothetical protein